MTELLGRCLGELSHSPLSLMTYVQSRGPAWWRWKTDSLKLVLCPPDAAAAHSAMI